MFAVLCGADSEIAMAAPHWPFLLPLACVLLLFCFPCSSGGKVKDVDITVADFDGIIYHVGNPDPEVVSPLICSDGWMTTEWLCDRIFNR